MPLFHVTAWHDAAHCPGFHRELMGPVIEALENSEEIASRYGVKLIGMYSGAPEHRDFLIVEAEAPFSVATFTTELLPYGELEKYDVTPVTPADELLEGARRMAETPPA